jgi:hypothetical protein
MHDDVIRSPDPEQPPSGSPPYDVPDGEITSDPIVAAEHGEIYHPPVDPPVVGMEDGDLRIAAGFAPDARSEPYDEDHHRGTELRDDEVTERVREALLADSLGSQYVDRLAIGTSRGIVVVEGVVEDLDFQDHILDLVASVSGVVEVRDRLRFPDEPAGGAGLDVRLED